MLSILWKGKTLKNWTHLCTGACHTTSSMIESELSGVWNLEILSLGQKALHKKFSGKRIINLSAKGKLRQSKDSSSQITKNLEQKYIQQLSKRTEKDRSHLYSRSNLFYQELLRSTWSVKPPRQKFNRMF